MKWSSWTDAEEQFLKENYGPLTAKEIATKLGRTLGAVENKIYWINHNQNKLKKREYAVYKGDDLIVIGTANECAEYMNVTPHYIYWMTTPAGKRRFENRKNPSRATTAIRLED